MGIYLSYLDIDLFDIGVYHMLFKRPSLLILLVVLAYSQETEFQGVATHFQTIGYPYGACGLPETVLEYDTQLLNNSRFKATNYVALNVFDSPGDYRSPGDFGPRPLEGGDQEYMGLYANGKNCGRWIEITLGDECDGNNGGEAGSSVCENETGWYSDSLNGAVLYALVTDQCSDNNLWCRDNYGHIDIRTQALNDFVLAGSNQIDPIAQYNELDGWTTSHWNNRKVIWKFMESPTSSLKINFWYAHNSGVWWKNLLISNLPNGIHQLQQWNQVSINDPGAWVDARMEGDMGQSWILPNPDLNPVFLRFQDVSGNWSTETYQIEFPIACAPNCTQAATLAISETLLFEETSQEWKPVSTHSKFESNSIGIDNSSLKIIGNRILIQPESGQIWFDAKGKKVPVFKLP
jgi:hypothetical protein